MNRPTTNKYLKQNRPSFSTIDKRVRHTMKISIRKNRQSRLSDIRYTAEGPIQPKVLTINKSTPQNSTGIAATRNSQGKTEYR